MWAFRALLAVGAVLMGLRTLSEWRAFRDGQSLLSGKHVRLRVRLGALVVITVVLIFGGTFVRWASPAAGLAYWGVCLLLTLAIAVVAWYDFKLVQLLGEQRLAELARERSRVLGQELAEADEGEDSDNGDSRPTGRRPDTPSSP
jgi:hypothetical protein